MQAVSALIGDDDVVGGILHRLCPCTVVVLGGEIVRVEHRTKVCLARLRPRDVVLGDILKAAVCELLANELAEAGDEVLAVDAACPKLLSGERIFCGDVDQTDHAHERAVCDRMAKLHRELLYGSVLDGSRSCRRYGCRLGCRPSLCPEEEQRGEYGGAAELRRLVCKCHCCLLS